MTNSSSNPHLLLQVTARLPLHPPQQQLPRQLFLGRKLLLLRQLQNPQEEECPCQRCQKSPTTKRHCSSRPTTNSSKTKESCEEKKRIWKQKDVYE